MDKIVGVGALIFCLVILVTLIFAEGKCLFRTHVDSRDITKPHPTLYHSGKIEAPTWYIDEVELEGGGLAGCNDCHKEHNVTIFTRAYGKGNRLRLSDARPND